SFETFEENALAKARYFYEASGGIPTFGDDSGMCVDALAGPTSACCRRRARQRVRPHTFLNHRRKSEFRRTPRRSISPWRVRSPRMSRTTRGCPRRQAWVGPGPKDRSRPPRNRKKSLSAPGVFLRFGSRAE